MKKWQKFIMAILGRADRAVYYIGGTDVLPAPLKGTQEQQALEDTKDPVKKFEILLRDYSEKKLQKVIEGRDYLPEAKKAAQNLLRRKGE